MQIYEKNRRLLKNKNLTLRYLLGQEKLRLIKKGLVEMEERNYQFGVKTMTLEELEEFYSLYSSFISEKENAKVYNLIALYTDRIQDTDEVYFGYIRNEKGLLIGGGIFTSKHDKELDTSITITGFRGYDPEIIIAKLRIGYYIEYLYNQRSLEEIKPIYLSRGKDRNAYGVIGSNPGLPIHKLQYKFLPYLSGEKIDLNEKNITQETLIFSNPNEDGIYQEAILYTKLSEEEIQEKYGLIEKRGLTLIVNKI